MGGRGMGRTRLVSEFGGAVQEGTGYGDLAGTSKVHIGKFSVQLSERRARLVYSTHRSEATLEGSASTLQRICAHRRNYLRFAGSPLFLQL